MAQESTPLGSREAALPPPLLAQCLAAEAQLPRSSGGQLLATVPGTQLLLAAVGTHLVLLRATPAGVAPVAALLEAHVSISAVTVSSSIGGDGQLRWAAALAGSTAHLVPFCVAALGGTEGDSTADDGDRAGCSYEAPKTAGAWQACAWHPSLPVCALAAPGQLLLVSMAGVGCSGHSRRSSSCAASPCSVSLLQSAEGKDGDSGSGGSTGRLLADLSTSAAASGRCCLAWLSGDVSSGSSSPGGPACYSRLVVGRGALLELLLFDNAWQLLARRELLAGLPGPVCGLAAAGSHAVVVSTERPVGSWLSHTALPEQREQQQQQRREAEVAATGLGRVLSPLHRAAASQQQAVLLPGQPSSSSSRGSPPLPEARAGGRHADLSLPSAASSDGGLIDLTGRRHSQSATTPSVPASFLLAPQHLFKDDHRSQILPGGGPPGLALPSSPPEQDGGHVTLLWLDSSGSEAAAAAPAAAPAPPPPPPPAAAAAAGSQGGACSSPASWAPPPELATAVQPLGLAPDLLQLLGGHAVLGGTRTAAPTLALCTLGPHQLHRICGAAQLALPDGVPKGGSTRLRGLAVLPAVLPSAAGSDGSGAAGTEAAAAAATAGAAPARALVWALFAVAAKTVTAPFLGAALAGSGQHQVWLACYSLEQLLECGAVAVGEPLAAAGVTHTCAAPSEVESEQELQEHGRRDGSRASSSGCLGPAAEAAVLALQGEVAALRRDVNARLDGVEAQLSQLLQALRQAP